MKREKGEGQTFTLEKYNLNMEIKEHEHKLMKLLIFAIVVFIVSYLPFTAALDLLKGFYDQSQNPLNFSLLTITIATMWDTVLCMVSFKTAFSDQVPFFLSFSKV